MTGGELSHDERHARTRRRSCADYRRPRSRGLDQRRTPRSYPAALAFRPYLDPFCYNNINVLFIDPSWSVE